MDYDSKLICRGFTARSAAKKRRLSKRSIAAPGIDLTQRFHRALRRDTCGDLINVYSGTRHAMARDVE